jgi:uncharacterized membrane protein (UPF0127 family)
MKLLKMVHSFERRAAEPQVPLQVKNLTRQSTLATRLEVADTSAKRNKGLLGHKGLAEGEGLWIFPCQSVHTVGMQFSIDLVYLDGKRRVKKVAESVPPWRMSMCLTAQSVLELPAGTIGATQTAKGDMLELSPLQSDAAVIAFR